MMISLYVVTTWKYLVILLNPNQGVGESWSRWQQKKINNKIKKIKTNNIVSGLERTQCLSADEDGSVDDDKRDWSSGPWVKTVLSTAVPKVKNEMSGQAVIHCHHSSILKRTCLGFPCCSFPNDECFVMFALAPLNNSFMTQPCLFLPHTLHIILLRHTSLSKTLSYITTPPSHPSYLKIP